MMWILPLALLSGLFGRMGGAGKHGHWYDWMLDTKWRDWGCALIITAVAAGMTGLQLQFWWVYALIFALHWAAFSTYWDDTKNKFLDWVNRRINWMYPADNMWLSGLMTGLAIFPIIFIDVNLWWIVALRAVCLMILWGCLNKFLPQRILCWNRDVAEEYVRYTVSL